MNKKMVCLAALLFLCLNSFALDLGVVAGSIRQPSSFFYGLSAGVGDHRAHAQVRVRRLPHQ